VRHETFLVSNFLVKFYIKGEESLHYTIRKFLIYIYICPVDTIFKLFKIKMSYKFYILLYIYVALKTNVPFIYYSFLFTSYCDKYYTCFSDRIEKALTPDRQRDSNIG